MLGQVLDGFVVEDDQDEPQENQHHGFEVVLLLKGEDGESFAARVSGCRVPLYWRLPSGWGAADVNALAQVLRSACGERPRARVECRVRMMGYVPDELGDPATYRFARLDFLNLRARRRAAWLLQTRGELAKAAARVPGARRLADGAALPTEVHMADAYRFPPLALVQLAYDVCPGRWLRIEGAEDRGEAGRLTRYVSREVDADAAGLRPLNGREDAAPQYAAFYDIETYSVDGQFPRARRPGDVVFNIGVVVARLDDKASSGAEVVENVVLCLGETAPADNTEVRWFAREWELLEAFAQIVNTGGGRGGCDFLISFNGDGFDMPYLNRRAEQYRYFCSGDRAPGEADWYRARREIAALNALRGRHARLAEASAAAEAKAASAASALNALDPTAANGKTIAAAEARKAGTAADAAAALQALQDLHAEAARVVDPDGLRPELHTPASARRHARRRRLPDMSLRMHVMGQYPTLYDMKEARRHFRAPGDVAPLEVARRLAESFFALGRRAGADFRQPYAAGGGDAAPVAPTVCGVTCMDLLQWFKRNCRYKSYRLEAIAQDLLGRGKVDLGYQEMFELYRNGGPAGRARIAGYCAVDCLLLLELLLHKQIHTQTLQLARVSKTMPARLASGKMQAPCWSVLRHNAFHEYGMVPNLCTRPKEGKYEGAVVLEPRVGFYEEPVSVLDFASLYPSIMMGYNVCYSTIVNHGERARALALEREGRLELLRVTTAGREHLFVQAAGARRQGMLARIEHGLKKRRSAVKKQMRGTQAEIDGLEKAGPSAALAAARARLANQDALQLAFKLIMNSLYGLAGAAVGYLPDWRVASSITAMGRRMIHATEAAVEAATPRSLADYTARCPRAPPGLAGRVALLAEGAAAEVEFQVVYGDTDSVFVRLRGGGGLSSQDIWDVSEAAALLVTHSTFEKQDAVILEMEKYYSSLCLIKKKKYVGLKHDGPGRKGKHGGKGTLAVRRDTVPFVKTLYNRIRDILFVQPAEMACGDAAATASKGSRRSAVLDELRATVRRLVDNKAAPEEVVLRMRASKPASAYAVPPPHVRVAEKLLRRHADGRPTHGVPPPKPGDYVEFVYVMPPRGTRLKAAKNMRAGELAEEAAHWRHHRATMLLHVPRYLERLQIVGELVGAVADPRECAAIIERGRLDFMRRWEGNRSLLDMWAPRKRKLKPPSAAACGKRTRPDTDACRAPAAART